MAGLVLLTSFFTFLLILGVVYAESDAGSGETEQCKNPMNAIIQENCLPGTPATEWDINGAGDPEIQGFSRQ